VKIKRAIIWAGGAAFLITVLLLAYMYTATGEQEYRTFASPDSRYKVVVFRSSVLMPVLPGQSSDAPGKVKLYDRAGNVLREAKVDMVQLVDHVEWEPRKVTIKLIAEWELPQ
jgi:hypothetical protein